MHLRTEPTTIPNQSDAQYSKPINFHAEGSEDFSRYRISYCHFLTHLQWNLKRAYRIHHFMLANSDFLELTEFHSPISRSRHLILSTVDNNTRNTSSKLKAPPIIRNRNTVTAPPVSQFPLLKTQRKEALTYHYSAAHTKL
jgi:hypothetical protein